MQIQNVKLLKQTSFMYLMFKNLAEYKKIFLFQNPTFSCILHFVLFIKSYLVVHVCPFTFLSANSICDIDGIILCDSFKLIFVTFFFKFHVSTVRLKPRQTGFANSDHITMTFHRNFYCFNRTLAYFLLVFSSSSINCLDLWDH